MKQKKSFKTRIASLSCLCVTLFDGRRGLLLMALVEHLTLEWLQITASALRVTAGAGRLEQFEKFGVVVGLYEITNACLDHFILKQHKNICFFIV
jgi:hypothetical protein